MKSDTRRLLEAIKKRKISIEEAISIIKNAKAPIEWKISDIEINVRSNGRTGKNWIKRLEKQGWIIDDNAKAILLSPDFIPTKGISTNILFKKYTQPVEIVHIKNNAKNYNFTSPNPEITCLICDYFTSKEFQERNLTNILIMHNPITPNDNLHGNLFIEVPMAWNAKKKLSALNLVNKINKDGWAYVFEVEK